MAVAVRRVISKLNRYGKLKHERRDGWLVGDADVGFSFKVTAKHIAAGVPLDLFKCPAALAGVEAMGKNFNFALNKGVVKVFDMKKKIMMRFATSAELRAAYTRFDKGLKPNFEPGAVYELLPMPGWLRLGTKKKKRKERRGTPRAYTRSTTARALADTRAIMALRDSSLFWAHIRPEDL